MPLCMEDFNCSHQRKNIIIHFSSTNSIFFFFGLWSLVKHTGNYFFYISFLKSYTIIEKKHKSKMVAHSYSFIILSKFTHPEISPKVSLCYVSKNTVLISTTGNNKLFTTHPNEYSTAISLHLSTPSFDLRSIFLGNIHIGYILWSAA